jgi:hypothetical protein
MTYTPSTEHIYAAYLKWRAKWLERGEPAEEFRRWADATFLPEFRQIWDDGFAEGMRQALAGENSPHNPYAAEAPSEPKTDTP